MSISGKVVLVTGAGQGIGRAIALRLANDGADIPITDLNEEKMSGVAEGVRAAGRRAIISAASIAGLALVATLPLLAPVSEGFGQGETKQG